MSSRSREIPGVLRAVALTALAAGAAGSLSFMFLTGSRQRSILLMALFTGWVLSPFVALGWAGLVATRWPRSRSRVVYAGSLVLTVVSLLMYSGVIPMPAGSRPAAVFLLIPLASWVLIAIGAWISSRSPHHGAALLLCFLPASFGCGQAAKPRVSQASLILEQVLRYQVQQFASSAENPNAVPVCLAVRDGSVSVDPAEEIMSELAGLRGLRPNSACPEGESIRLVAGPIERVRDDEVRVKGEYRRHPGIARPLAYRVILENGRWRCAGPIVSFDPL